MNIHTLTPKQMMAENIDNALSDTLASMKSGDFMVYYTGVGGLVPHETLAATHRKSFMERVRFFAKPRAPASVTNRIWDYMVQKV